LRIGIFDSGLGGLTVAASIKKEIPQAQLVYFGDTARVPYGPKSKGTIQRYAKQDANFLLSKHIDILVIACNTATSFALELLKKEYNLPIIGVVEPGVKAALTASKEAIIGIIGTIGTIKSNAYQEGISRFKPRATIIAKSCPLFVPLVEEGFLYHAVTRLIAEEYLDVLKRARIDTLVLACTHYPLLKPVIQDILGEDVRIVDSAIETAREVVSVASQMGLMPDTNQEPVHEFYLSDIDYSFSSVVLDELGLGDLNPVEVDIEEF